MMVIEDDQPNRNEYITTYCEHEIEKDSRIDYHLVQLCLKNQRYPKMQMPFFFTEPVYHPCNSGHLQKDIDTIQQSTEFWSSTETY